MNEKQQAFTIANAWLDFEMNPLTQMVPGDPDCDACVLARQFIRLRETLSDLMATIDGNMWASKYFTDAQKRAARIAISPRDGGQTRSSIEAPSPHQGKGSK